MADLKDNKIASGGLTGAQTGKMVFVWCLAVIAFVAGRSLCGVVHELGHAAVAWVLGGQVYSMQPWLFLGRAHTHISHISPSRDAIVILSGVVFPNILGVLAVLTVPWNRLSRSVALVLAVFLLPLVASSWEFGFEFAMPGVHGDAAIFILYSGLDELLVCFLGLVVLAGSIWLWLRRTRFLRCCYAVFFKDH